MNDNNMLKTSQLVLTRILIILSGNRTHTHHNIYNAQPPLSKNETLLLIPFFSLYSPYFLKKKYPYFLKKKYTTASIILSLLIPLFSLYSQKNTQQLPLASLYSICPSQIPAIFGANLSRITAEVGFII